MKNPDTGEATEVTPTSTRLLSVIMGAKDGAALRLQPIPRAILPGKDALIERREVFDRLSAAMLACGYVYTF